MKINLKIYSKVHNVFIVFGILFGSFFQTFGQNTASNTPGLTFEKDTIPQFLGSPVEVTDKQFLRMYRRYKPIVLKVYPYALQSADVLDKMNNDLESIQKRRKRNKFLKKSYKKLKTDYKYVFLNMYTSEGKVLTKLVARETGMTIHQIIRKYRGRKDAALFSLMGKMFDQDLKSPYDSKKEYVLEAIIRDIESGEINFNNNVKTIDKAVFKHEQAEAKKRRKVNKIRIKKIKKDRRVRNRTNRKAKRNNKSAATK